MGGIFRVDQGGVRSLIRMLRDGANRDDLATRALIPHKRDSDAYGVGVKSSAFRPDAGCGKGGYSQNYGGAIGTIDDFRVTRK